MELLFHLTHIVAGVNLLNACLSNKSSHRKHAGSEMSQGDSNDIQREKYAAKLPRTEQVFNVFLFQYLAICLYLMKNSLQNQLH